MQVYLCSNSQNPLSSTMEKGRSSSYINYVIESLMASAFGLSLVNFLHFSNACSISTTLHISSLLMLCQRWLLLRIPSTHDYWRPDEMKKVFLTLFDHVPGHIVPLSDNIGKENTKNAFNCIFIPSRLSQLQIVC